MFRLGTLWGYGAEYIPLDDEVERISRVTVEEIRSCCARFPLVPTVKVVVMPEDGATGDEDDGADEADAA
jgi:hypothetical protein